MLPNAPIAAASLGVARPKRIEPKTAKIKTARGTNEVTNKNIDQVKTEKRQQVFNEKKQYLNANEDFKRICSVLDAEVIN